MRIGNIASFKEIQKSLEWLRLNICHLVIADPVTVGMSGVDLVAKIREAASAVPIILTSRSSDLDEAVKAVRAGAEAFLEKPNGEGLLLSEGFLVAVVENALRRSETGESLLGRLFSEAEQKVLQLTLEGKSADDIAKELHCSRKTTLFCRQSILRKLALVKSVCLRNWYVDLRWGNNSNQE